MFTVFITATAIRTKSRRLAHVSHTFMTKKTAPVAARNSVVQTYEAKLENNDLLVESNEHIRLYFFFILPVPEKHISQNEAYV